MSESPYGLIPYSSATLGTPGDVQVFDAETQTRRYADSFADYLPGGRMFEAKRISGTNLRKLLRGFAKEAIRADNYIQTLQDEYMPDTTTLFLDEWEFVLGIPDDCFDGTGSAADRRTAILVKLASLGVQTVDDFQALAARFGLSVNIHPGKDVYDTPSLAPGLTFANEKRARFTIVVTFNFAAGEAFTYTFPIPFGTSEVSILECLFNNVKPANCQVIFQNI